MLKFALGAAFGATIGGFAVFSQMITNDDIYDASQLAVSKFLQKKLFGEEWTLRNQHYFDQFSAEREARR